MKINDIFASNLFKLPKKHKIFIIFMFRIFETFYYYVQKHS